MHLTREEVQNISLLARLRLGEEELESLARELGQIVEFVDRLGELDTENVEPMAHAAEVHGVFRCDEPSDSLDRADALANAPRSDGECFLVPPVLG